MSVYYVSCMRSAYSLQLISSVLLSLDFTCFLYRQSVTSAVRSLHFCFQLIPFDWKFPLICSLSLETLPSLFYISLVALHLHTRSQSSFSYFDCSPLSIPSPRLGPSRWKHARQSSHQHRNSSSFSSSEFFVAKDICSSIGSPVLFPVLLCRSSSISSLITATR